MSKLILGCGYLGLRVARLWQAAGEAEVWAVTRSAARAEEFRRLGLRPLIGDITLPESLTRLPPVEDVLFAVGYDGRPGGPTIGEVFVRGLAGVLERLGQRPRTFTYISSTGVYGQNQGEWVDETSPCAPTREGGRACLAAEQLLEASPIAQQALVLRLAGLYGPGRLPRLADLRTGKPIAAPADGYLNLIHVDDAARIVVDLVAHASTPLKLAVADGSPVLRRDYLGELARLLGAPEPRFAPPEAGSHAAARATADKRIDNGRLRQRLTVPLHYPSYREGLRAIVQSGTEEGADR